MLLDIMRACVIFSLLAVTVSGFSLVGRTSIHNSRATTTAALRATDNANDFAAKPPVPVAVDDAGTPIVDLDELSKESAAKASFVPSIDISDMIVKGKREAPRQAEWLPMLLSPKALDGSMAGDVGFDPLGFSSDKAALMRMREAEIKHCRLAMLAAAGWPLSELWHKEIADNLGLDSILSSNDRAPSILNGGLSNEWIIGTGIATLALAAALELQAFKAQEKTAYKPGDYGFDPLGLYSIRSSFSLDKIAETLSREEKIANAKFDMELCEIKNGRLAMLAIAADAAQEFISGIPVVDQSPYFFGDRLY